MLSPVLRNNNVKEWFGCQSDISLDLWVAPDVIDLQYMTCLPCDKGSFVRQETGTGRGLFCWFRRDTVKGMQVKTVCLVCWRMKLPIMWLPTYQMLPFLQ